MRYDSLIIVTADYHMPRAMLELRGRHAGGRSDPLCGPDRRARRRPLVAHRTGARRMMVEYCKYLAVLAREAFLRLGPPRHADAANRHGARPLNAFRSPLYVVWLFVGSTVLAIL